LEEVIRTVSQATGVELRQTSRRRL
jgi:hypothetical protein